MFFIGLLVIRWLTFWECVTEYGNNIWILIFILDIVIFLMLLLLSGLLFYILRSKTGLCKLWVLKKWCYGSWSTPWSITILGRKGRGDYFFRNKFNILWMATSSLLGLKTHFPFVQRRMKTDHDLAKTDVLFLFLLVFFYFFLFFWITLSVISFLRQFILIREKKIKWLLGNCTVFSILTF